MLQNRNGDLEHGLAADHAIGDPAFADRLCGERIFEAEAYGPGFKERADFGHDKDEVATIPLGQVLLITLELVVYISNKAARPKERIVLSRPTSSLNI